MLFRAPAFELVAPAPVAELDDDDEVVPEPLEVAPVSLVEPIDDVPLEFRLSVLLVPVEEHAATPIATRPARISF